MSTDEIMKKLIELVKELFKDKGFDTDIIEYVDLIDDVGMDSITFISIVVEVEAMFDIIIPDDILLMENFRKVDNIVNVVENVLSLKSSGDEGDDNVET